MTTKNTTTTADGKSADTNKATTEKPKKPVKRGVDSSVVKFTGKIDGIAIPLDKPITLKVIVSEGDFIDVQMLRRIQGEISRIEICPHQVDAFRDNDDRNKKEKPNTRMEFVLRYAEFDGIAHILKEGADKLPETLVERETLCGANVRAQVKDKPKSATVCANCKKVAKEKGA